MNDHDVRTTAAATTDPTAASQPGKDTMTARVYGDHHTNAHDAPYERKLPHLDKHAHWAKQDQFNKPGIKADSTGARQAGGRPGVVTKTGQGIFSIKEDRVTRFTFTNRGGKNVAAPFDVITKAKLAPYNYNAKLTDEEKAKNGDQHVRLLLNPAKPKLLHIGDKNVLCVLSWLDGMGAAWIPLDKLAGDTQVIEAAVEKRSEHDPDNANGKSTHYVIRNDHVGQSTPQDDGDVLAPGKHNGDNVDHYLEHDKPKPEFNADNTAKQTHVTRGFVALCMNLPEGQTAPVAIDTALAGDSFFALDDKQFHREVSVYGNGKHHSDTREMWVFGHLGKVDDTHQTVPDKQRRGWVPRRVLALKSDLVK